MRRASKCIRCEIELKEDVNEIVWQPEWYHITGEDWYCNNCYMALHKMDFTKLWAWVGRVNIVQ